MKTESLFGIRYFIWGIISLVIAAIYILVWPHELNAGIPSWQLFILRWFHALVWILLSLSFWIREFNILGGKQTADLIAKTALIVYLSFIGTFVYNKFIK